MSWYSMRWCRGGGQTRDQNKAVAASSVSRETCGLHTAWTARSLRPIRLCRVCAGGVHDMMFDTRAQLLVAQRAPPCEAGMGTWMFSYFGVNFALSELQFQGVLKARCADVSTADCGAGISGAACVRTAVGVFVSPDSFWCALLVFAAGLRTPTWKCPRNGFLSYVGCIRANTWFVCRDFRFIPRVLRR